MRFMKFVCSCLASLFALSVTFSKISLGEAYAVGLPTDGRLMDFAEAAAVFGDRLQVTYMDNSGVFHNDYAYLQSNTNTNYSISNTNGFVDDTGYIVANRRFIQYECSVVSLNSQPQNITVRIHPEYSIFDTEYIYTALCISTNSSGGSTNIQAYNSPSWEWNWNGENVIFSPSELAVNNVLPHLYFYNQGYTMFDFVPAYMTSQGTTAGYSIEATWDHAYAPSNKLQILIGLPYVSNDANGVTGTPASSSTTTSQNINVNVDVDLSTTNTLLGGVIAAIQNVASAILNGLANLFIPTQEQLEDWKDDMQQLLADHLGGLYEAVDYITDFLQNLTTAEPATYIHINKMTVPIKYIRVGSSPPVLDTYNFVLGPYDVDLKYDDLNLIYDGLALIVDFLATWYFLNMCRNKLEIILNPDSEKIEE